MDGGVHWRRDRERWSSEEWWSIDRLGRKQKNTLKINVYFRFIVIITISPQQTQAHSISLRRPRPRLLPLKVQTDAINTMPLIRRRRVPLPLEHMPQMPAALGARDLGARHAEGAVRVADNGAGDAVEVGGPAAAGLELVRGAVEGGVAGGAGVGAGVGGVLVVGARVGGLGAFFTEDTELFCGKVNRMFVWEWEEVEDDGQRF